MSEERAGKFPAVMFLGNWFLTDDFRVFTHMRFVFEETRVRADGTRSVSDVDRMLSEQLPGLRDAVYKAVSTVELENHGDRPMVVHQGGVLRADPRAGSARRIGFHLHGQARSHHPRPAVRPPGLSLRAHLLQLGGRHRLLLGELREPQRRAAKRLVGTGRSPPATPHRSSLWLG